MLHRLIVLCAVAYLANANICTEQLRGQCYDLFTGLNGGCTPGHVYTYSYCGIFQMCCYYQQTGVVTVPHVTQPHITAAPTVHTGPVAPGQCGHTSVGTTANKIVGGRIAQHGEFPWQVSIRYMGQHVCGGTLVSDTYVVTAAHCFEDLGTYATQWTIGVGLQYHVSNSPNNVIHVSRVTPHERFNQRTNENDIAVIKLSKPIDLTGPYTRAACLPESSDQFVNDVCTVSGWGATYYDPNGRAPVTDQLEYVNLRTISNTDCTYYLGYGSIHPSNICAGATSTGGQDACQGDSGGPLVCKRSNGWVLTGVVSWGDGCGKARRPGVYTRVTSFLDWVRSHMY
ncbi:transmembrane protease serine 3-like [Dreissena polymorpha]|uniref:Peptidase S1 domain-containing protein n=1 Tax=Dreissena polymorpha TaxID=45954 RepID=A0A9D4DF04_DREPO|nr:transmembrane protease serine 3-like [Dreissena polymorpha]KAH3746872.1 hypothetical protein DPMN_181289 [Dreissena polymorpha]